ncbi:hypothetical protein GCM10023238_40010 [Streptomyces heliomycini]
MGQGAVDRFRRHRPHGPGGGRPGEPGGHKGHRVDGSRGPLVSAPPEGAEARFQSVMAGTTVRRRLRRTGPARRPLVRARLHLRRLAEWEEEWRRSSRRGAGA